MKFALVNPPWVFDGSIYFGCREPHLPLEFGYARHTLEQAGHDVLLLDGLLGALSLADLRSRLKVFRPDFTVITTAPSYLFWRCPPPEIRVPRETADAVRDLAGVLIVVGPHGSTTPRPVLRKLDAGAVVLGECEEILPRLTEDWSHIEGLCFSAGDSVRVQGAPHMSDMKRLPALRWSMETLRRHTHHHHRFDSEAAGPGAELEASRGCPYHCTFCAKENFRNNYRKRPLPVVLEEIDQLIGRGAAYLYFIDEIFLPDRALLEAVRERRIKYGIQTRIDLWNEPMIDLLGESGCVSVEAGVESISEEGRDYLDKRCKLSTGGLADRLIYAKKRIPFVQANLLSLPHDDRQAIEEWRERLIRSGVWANEPVPLFPYPGSPDYTRLWGAPDDRAWERAHEYYLGGNRAFSDIQEQTPLPLVQLEAALPHEG